MARPREVGLRYFSLNCVLDDKVEMLETAHSNDGFAVLIKLWQEIYQSENGELDISDILRRRTLAKKANVAIELWENIVETCVQVGLFDEEARQRGILTSSGVKKHIQKVAEEREKARIRFERSSSVKNSRRTPESKREKRKEKDTTPPLPPEGESAGAEPASREELDRLAEQHRFNPAYGYPEDAEVVEYLVAQGASPQDAEDIAVSMRADSWKNRRGEVYSDWRYAVRNALNYRRKNPRGGSSGGMPRDAPMTYQEAQRRAHKESIANWTDHYIRLRKKSDGKMYFRDPAYRNAPIPEGYELLPT